METSNVLEPSLLIWGLDPKIVAIGIVTICYLVIFSEKVNRAIMALLGAAAMIVSGILTQKTALAGIDFNTIGLLVGMMVIVAIAERSGMFQYVEHGQLDASHGKSVDISQCLRQHSRRLAGKSQDQMGGGPYAPVRAGKDGPGEHFRGIAPV